MFAKSLACLCVVALLLTGLSACGSSNQAIKSNAGVDKNGKNQGVASSAVKSADTKAQAAAPQPASGRTPPVSVVLKDVNFDFDKYLITPVGAETLKQNWKWFSANPNGRLRVEGNCDERGTTEYNMALGQKRADAAKKFLTDLGVDGKRIETVSYGKEKPLDSGHTEEAWAKNRRDRFAPLP